MKGEPNMQNIPLRTETAKRIREAFIDIKELEVDYASLERRIIKHYGGQHD